MGSEVKRVKVNLMATLMTQLNRVLANKGLWWRFRRLQFKNINIFSNVWSCIGGRRQPIATLLPEDNMLQSRSNEAQRGSYQTEKLQTHWQSSPCKTYSRLWNPRTWFISDIESWEIKPDKLQGLVHQNHYLQIKCVFKQNVHLVPLAWNRPLKPLCNLCLFTLNRLWTVAKITPFSSYRALHHYTALKSFPME